MYRCYEGIGIMSVQVFNGLVNQVFTLHEL